MLESLGYKIIEKGINITATKEVGKGKDKKTDSTIKAMIGSNLVRIDKKDIYLDFIIWEIDDIVKALDLQKEVVVVIEEEVE